MTTYSIHGHFGQHHRTTLEQIARHPTTGNLEWHDVIALLNEVAEVREEHDGKFVVKLADDRIVLTKPRHKTVDEQMVVDLRRLFRDAGFLQVSE